jgi:Flp pilus assembly protein TadD
VRENDASRAPSAAGGVLTWGLLLIVAACAGFLVYLRLGPDPAPGAPRPAEGAEDSVAALNEGVALLEQYRYLDAYKVFDRLSRAHPAWEAAHVNRGLAALNLQNEYLKIAEEAFRRAIEINARSPHALVSLGILYYHLQRVDDARRTLQAAVEVAPDDPHALYYLSAVVEQKGEAAEARRLLEEALRLQPSFASAIYKLRAVYLKAGDRAKMDAALVEFQRLEKVKAGVKTGLKYGEAGRYNMAIRDAVPPGWKGPAPAWEPAAAPAFLPEVKIVDGAASAPSAPRPDGKPPSPPFAAADLTGDGVVDLVVPGPEAASIRAGGDWREIGTLPGVAFACAIGDLDGDRDPDVALAGEGWLEIHANDGKGSFAKSPATFDGASHAGFPLRLYLLDADSDWDLDVICLRQERADGGKVRSRIEVLNNNRDGSFREIAAEAGIGPFDFAVAELLAADFDGDVDLDLVALAGAGGEPAVFANDRVWRYRPVRDSHETARDSHQTARGSPAAAVLESAAVGDLDGDGDEDIVCFGGAALRLLKNSGGLRFEEDTVFAARFGAVGGTAGVAGDFQGALQVGLCVLDGRSGPAAGGGAPGPVFIAGAAAAKAVPLAFERPLEPPLSGCLAPAGDGGADLLVRDAKGGLRALRLQVPGTWIALDLEGPKEPIPDKERANVAGVGATVEVRAGTKRLVAQAGAGGGGAARGPTRIFSGLRGASAADYVRILWPDGVLQSERGLTAGKVHRIREEERKPSSCPVLFAWDGSGFAYVGDFLGVGGLGYFELPGIYSRPDPTEYVLLPRLAPLDGRFLIDVLEPLEECTYLDELKLTVVEHPAAVTVLPDEMFAVKGPAPEHRLLAFRDGLRPERATDGEGGDATSALRAVDRRYGNRVERDPRFPGLARRTHAIEMDFGAGAERVARGARPYLFLHGFVEYGYSTSNFAAWQARESFRAPTVKVERGGSWVALREEWGFPAGTPRYMAVDLAGLLRPGDRRFRVETNMEIHWDEAILADASAGEEIEAADLDADMAVLEYVGYPREESPDGSIPPVYVHGEFAPSAPHKPFPGSYTRHGDVRPLLAGADDRFAIFGPGDGIRVGVRADRLPPLGEGRARTFLLKAFGYCKDMDLYTAHPDQVEPLPFRAMSGYPYGAGEAYPATPENEAYRREWNTRRVPPAPFAAGR